MAASHTFAASAPVKTLTARRDRSNSSRSCMNSLLLLFNPSSRFARFIARTMASSSKSASSSSSAAAFAVGRDASCAGRFNERLADSRSSAALSSSSLLSSRRRDFAGNEWDFSFASALLSDCRLDEDADGASAAFFFLESWKLRILTDQQRHWSHMRRSAPIKRISAGLTFRWLFFFIFWLPKW